MRQDAVVIPTVAGQQYVVSMFGTISDWVQNLEAAKGEAVISHGGSVRVRLVKVSADERAPILREYVRVASSGRKHLPLPVGYGPTKSAVETIVRSASSLTQMIEDVLDVSRIVSGKLRLDVQPVEMSGIVREAIETAQPAADAKSIRLDVIADRATR
jgi:signal transduction histidine kinase